MLWLLVALTSSASPVLLQDIEPGAAVDSETYLEVDTGADPNVLVIQNDFWGTELFTLLDSRRTLVTDLCPGPCSGNPTQLTRVGTRLFFLASDLGEPFPNQLWITDGTAQGTLKLADGVPSSATRTPRIIVVGDQLLFMKGKDLWVSNGTREGTTALSWGVGRELVSAQVTPLHRFISVNPAACELFVSGTDVRQATPLPMPAMNEGCAEPIAAIGERAFVGLTSGIFRFDATPAPAVMIDAAGTTLTRAGPGLFFFRGPAVFRSTGEPGSTVALGNVAGLRVKDVAATGARLLYSAIDPTNVAHLYSSDGTPAGTFEIPISATSTHAILPVGPVAYVITVIAGALGTELVETDGTSSGTSVLQGVHPLHAAAQPGHREAKGHAVALALIANVLNEFGAFRIRPGEDPESIFLKPGNPRGSFPSSANVNSNSPGGASAFFTARGQVFRTDGTPDATVPFFDGGFVGFANHNPVVSQGTALMSIDLDGGAVTSLGAEPFVSPTGLSLDNLALFTEGAGPRSLWSTDGTAAGTTRLTDVGMGLALEPIRLGDGRGVFTIADRLWFSDGTPGNTRTVTVPGLTGKPAAGQSSVWVVTGPTSIANVTIHTTTPIEVEASLSGPELLTARDEELFFVTRTAAGTDLWRARFGSVTRLSPMKSVRALAVYRGRVMMLGDPGGDTGQLLLEIVEAGLVTRVAAPGSTFLHAAGDKLFVDAALPATGLELHYLQEHGALSFLIPVGEISPGPGSSNPSAPVAVNGRFVFSAWSPEAGREPWAWEPGLPPPAQRGCGCGAEGGLSLVAVLMLGRLRRRKT